MTATAEKTVIIPKLGNLTLLRASDVGTEWGLNLLVYGQSGSGKTTLCGTAQDSPHGRDVLFFDLEGGTLSISDRPDVLVYRPAKWDDIQTAYQQLAQGGHTFKTIIFDSLTEAQQLAVKEASGAAGTDLISQQNWGKANNMLLRMVRAFRGLTYTQSINTIFTALEREVKDDQTGAVRIGPALTPGSQINIGAACDSVGYLTWSPKTGKRILHLEGDGRFMAKCRQPATNRRLPKSLEDPSLVTILEALKGGGKD